MHRPLELRTGCPADQILFITIFKKSIFRLHYLANFCDFLTAMQSLPRTSLYLCWIAFTFGFLSSCLAQRPGRCDQERETRRWSKCVECSVNRLRSCPSGYQKLTSGEGRQRCSFRAHFGFRFGFVKVRGCQHLCVKKIKIKECCDGFWGPDCQGIF